jgi:hypothetical protein
VAGSNDHDDELGVADRINDSIPPDPKPVQIPFPG